MVEVTSFFTSLCSPCYLVGYRPRKRTPGLGTPTCAQATSGNPARSRCGLQLEEASESPCFTRKPHICRLLCRQTPLALCVPSTGQTQDTEEAHLISTGTSDFRSPMGETPANPKCASITMNCLQVLEVPWRQSPHTDGLACTCGLRFVACFRGRALWRRELRATGGAPSF